jgi:hypothetical protein
MQSPQPLTPLNTQLAAVGELPKEIWHEWLWGSDPEEPYHLDVLLNRNHLLGILVCRYKHLNGRILGGSAYYASQQRMTIMDKPVENMSWRELKDTVANILIEWPMFLDRLKLNLRAKQNLKQVLHLVNLCASRFGALAYMAAGQDLMDDTSETQPCTQKEHQDKLMLTAGALRRMAGSLLIMFRHLHLLSMCIKVPNQGFHAGISKYHYEASNDAFNVLCMHFSLPVAARLNYRHDFPGMYNHVSQVVYFHNNQYSRTARLPLDDIKTASAVHVLPALQELYPEIPLKYEEDMFDPTKNQGWYWLLLAGRVYLVTPNPSVLYCENVCDLLRVYIDRDARGQKEALNALEQQTREVH